MGIRTVHIPDFFPSRVLRNASEKCSFPLQGETLNRSYIKRLLGGGVAAAIVAAGLAVGVSPAGATITNGAINCTASIPALTSSVSLQNPTSSHVSGPVWSAQGAAATITNPAGVQILPSGVGGQLVSSFRDLKQGSMLLGLNTGVNGQNAGDTTLAGPFDTDIPLNGFTYDPDLTDAVPAIPMDGVATYNHTATYPGSNNTPLGVVGPFPKPILRVTQGNPLVVAGGTYYISVSISPSPAEMKVANGTGTIGGAITSPAQPLSITDVGAANGPIKYINTSTALTAKVLGVIDAITTCTPSASPAHTIHVHTQGTYTPDDSAGNTTEPLAACKPTANTQGLLKYSKGYGTGGTAPAAAGSLSATLTYDGCVVPDVQAVQWAAIKFGAPTLADATNTKKAVIALKAKNFGDCTNVDTLTAAGRSHNYASPNHYGAYGSIAASWTDASAKPIKTKLPAVSATSRLDIVVDTTGPTPGIFLEGKGIGVKGLGIGADVYLLAELDQSNLNVQKVLGCNGVGAAPAPGVYLGGVAPYLTVKTAENAVFQVETR